MLLFRVSNSNISGRGAREPFGTLRDNGAAPVRFLRPGTRAIRTHAALLRNASLIKRRSFFPVPRTASESSVVSETVGRYRGSERDDRIWDALAELEIVQISVALLIDVSWKNDARGLIKLIFLPPREWGKKGPVRAQSCVIRGQFLVTSICYLCWI